MEMNLIRKTKNVQEIQDERFMHQDSFWNGCTDVTSGTPLEHFFTKILIFSDIVEWHYSKARAHYPERATSKTTSGERSKKS